MSVCACLSVGHNCELCWNGWTDRDATWDVDLCGPEKTVIRLGSSPQGKVEIWATSPSDLAHCGVHIWHIRGCSIFPTVFHRLQKWANSASLSVYIALLIGPLTIIALQHAVNDDTSARHAGSNSTTFPLRYVVTFLLLTFRKHMGSVIEA